MTVLLAPARAGYLYISSNLEPDSTTPVVLLEADLPLEPVPPGFSLTTEEEVHAMLLLAPSEALAQAQNCSGPSSDIFGSFIYRSIGPVKDTAHDGYGQSGPNYKWVHCGGWTESVIGDTTIGVWGATNRDRVRILEYPWRTMHVFSPLQRLRYVCVFCYELNETHYWEQFSQHKWWPSGNQTNSGAQAIF